MEVMDKKDLTDDDKKLWEWLTKNVTPMGENSAPDTPNKVVSFSDIIREAEIKLKPKQKSKNRYDVVMDLHGMTRNEAFHKMEIVICREKLRGTKTLLIITGKGHGKGEGLGILKRKVPMWLGTPKFKRLVKGWKQAEQRDGGEGAIYVYLRGNK